MEDRIGGRIDAQDGHRGRRRAPRQAAEEGPALDRRGRVADAGRAADCVDGLGGETVLEERRDTEVGPADDVIDGS